MKYKTRWLMKKEYEALEKVVFYLNDDERKDYEAREENNEPTRGHIWKAVKILLAYVEEIYGSFQAIESAIDGQIKHARRAGEVFQFPDETLTSSREPHMKRARPSVKAYGFNERKRRKPSKEGRR